MQYRNRGFSETSGLLIITLTDLLVITALILTSRWAGWKLAIILALAYYGAVTFLTQIETASFTFIFGIFVVWLLHRRHHSFADLLGIRRSNDR